MAMSKKDCAAVAAVINAKMAPVSDYPARDIIRRGILGGVAGDLANVFAADNPRFDSAKFLAACGVA